MSNLHSIVHVCLICISSWHCSCSDTASLSRPAVVNCCCVIPPAPNAGAWFDTALEREAMPLLQQLHLDRNRLDGTLPPAWGLSRPELQSIRIISNSLTGSLPAGKRSSPLGCRAENLLSALDISYIHNASILGTIHHMVHSCNEFH